jgi:Domain of unknown function (DUF4261)
MGWLILECMGNPVASIYAAELFFTKAPSLPRGVLLDKLAGYCPGLEALEGNPASDLLAFRHPAHTSKSEDGLVPAQYLITPRSTSPDMDQLRPAIRQSWAFPEAGAVLAACRYSLIVSDFQCTGLEYDTRMKLFQGVLRATIESVSCEAIHWVTSQHVLRPETYMSQLEGQGLLTGALHVRLFQVSGGTPDDLLVDTVGLWAFGLPDVQCKFRGLDPTQVANHVYGVAAYLFEKGDVIQNGHTITGVPSTSRWTCRQEESAAQPDRLVLNLSTQ